MYAIVKRMRAIIVSMCAFVILVQTGCSPKTVVVPFTHIVEYPGENLGVIAQWHTGSVENWKTIAAENPSVNPRKLKVGDQVSIPRNIVVCTEDLPKEMLVKFHRRRSATPRSKAKSAAKDSGGEDDQDESFAAFEAEAETSVATETPPQNEKQDKLIRAILGSDADSKPQP
jgi:hypothetical protein